MKLFKNGVTIASKEIEDYENDTLSFDRKVDLFQRLIDSGMLWRFRNDYIVEANNLITRGYVYER
tara:strand:+ start:58 stop:252 length:195 start_codon:yes stop_codon:yes gene_type:complete